MWHSRRLLVLSAGGEIPHVEGKVIDFKDNWEAHCQMVRAANSNSHSVNDANAEVYEEEQGGIFEDGTIEDEADENRGVSRHYNDMAYAPRILPTWKDQVWVFFKRRLVQFRRAIYTHALDLLLVAFGGAVLGGTYLNATWNQYPQMATFSSLVIGMTSMLFSLRYFGNDTDVIRREASSGIGITPFFFAGNLVQLPMVFVLPMVYLAVVFPMLSPRSTMSAQYVSILLRADQLVCVRSPEKRYDVVLPSSYWASLRVCCLTGCAQKQHHKTPFFIVCRRCFCAG